MEGKEGNTSSLISPANPIKTENSTYDYSGVSISIATACDLIIKDYLIPDSTKVHQFHKRLKSLRKSPKYSLRQFEDQDEDFESDASFVGPSFTKVHFPKNMKFSSSSGEEPSEDSRDDTKVLSPSISAYSDTSSRITRSTSSNTSFPTGSTAEETFDNASTATEATQSSNQKEEESENKEEAAENKEEVEVKREEVILTSTMVIR